MSAVASLDTLGVFGSEVLWAGGSLDEIGYCAVASGSWGFYRIIHGRTPWCLPFQASLSHC